MIYVFRMQGTSYYKLGVTEQDASQRLQQVQTSCPLEVEVYRLFPGGLIEESIIHAALNDYRSYGEWFFIPRSPIRFLRHRLWRAGQEIKELEDILEPLPTRETGRRMKPEYDWEIEIQRSRGKTYPEISKLVGVSEWAVKNCCLQDYKYRNIRSRSEKQRQKRREQND